MTRPATAGRVGAASTTWGIAPVLAVISLALAFAMSAAVYPLYFQSQNQYFFHGLVRASIGLLGEDWLARTAEPWPLFSLLVTLTQRFLHPAAFYLYYALLFGLYAYGLTGIVAWLDGARASRSKSIAFVALLAALHSAAGSTLSQQTLGFNLGGQLTSGVALQNLLGPGLQPATFGALLVLSISLFLRERPVAAAACAAGAAVVHPVYLLPAGLLAVAFAALMLARGEGVRKAGIVAGVALLVTLPMLIYVSRAFGPSDPEAWATSRTILVHFRFPHHAIPARWFGPMVYLKLGIVIAALLIVRRTALFWILGVLLAAAGGLTVVQVLSASPSLAVLFPWRVSVLLVPLATAVVLGSGVGRVLDGLEHRVARSAAIVTALSLVLLLALGAPGLRESVRRFAAGGRGDRAEMIEFVRRTKARGESYVIPRYWEDFRLATGAPAFVDFNFIPYEDRAVLEWYRRVRLIDAFYAAPAESRCRLLGGVAAAYPVTHVVLEGGDLGACSGWQALYTVGVLRLYGRRS